MGMLLIMPLIFLVCFVGILLLVLYMFKTIMGKMQDVSQVAFGTDDLIEGLKQNEKLYEQTPKSLSRMDNLLIPQIQEDFPDFNVDLAKSYAKAELKKYLNNPIDFRVHEVVINDYNDYNNEKTIIMQASAEMKDKDGKKVQKRYSLNYTYLLVGEGVNDGANCPNCGAPLQKVGGQICEYCDSRVAEVLSNTWEFTDVAEI